MKHQHTHYWFAPKGKEYITEGTFKMYWHGLSMSKSPLEALTFGYSPILYGVSTGDEGIFHWRLDCTDILEEFARWCALEVSHLWDIPDVVRRFLETGDENLREEVHGAADAYRAEAAAYFMEDYHAAMAAYSTIDTYSHAAGSAMESRIADADAAWHDVYDSVYSVRAAYAARDAVHDNFREKQNAKLEEMIISELEKDQPDE